MPSTQRELWTQDEDDRLLAAYADVASTFTAEPGKRVPQGTWQKVAAKVGSRSALQCHGRYQTLSVKSVVTSAADFDADSASDHSSDTATAAAAAASTRTARSRSSANGSSGSSSSNISRTTARHVKWTEAENTLLRSLVARYDPSAIRWKEVAGAFRGRSHIDCHFHWYNSASPNLNKSPLADDEKRRIVEYVERNIAQLGKPKWSDVAREIGNGRTAIQCSYYYKHRPKAAGQTPARQSALQPPRHAAAQQQQQLQLASPATSHLSDDSAGASASPPMLPSSMPPMSMSVSMSMPLPMPPSMLSTLVSAAALVSSASPAAPALPSDPAAQVIPAVALRQLPYPVRTLPSPFPSAASIPAVSTLSTLSTVSTVSTASTELTPSTACGPLSNSSSWPSPVHTSPMHMLPSPLPSPSTPSSASPPPSLPVSNVAAPWTAGEDALLLSTYYRVCDSSPPSSGLWKLIASSVASRNARQCSRRWTTLQASASAERRFDCDSAFTPADRIELALAVRRHGRRFVLISDNYFPRRAPHFLINRAQEQTL